MLQRFPVLHEAGRHRPVATARLDRTAAEQNALPVLGHAANDQPRVLIMDGAAGLADVARQIVAGGGAVVGGGAALAAEIHDVREGIRAELRLVDAAAYRNTSSPRAKER